MIKRRVSTNWTVLNLVGSPSFNNDTSEYPVKGGFWDVEGENGETWNIAEVLNNLGDDVKVRVTIEVIEQVEWVDDAKV